MMMIVRRIRQQLGDSVRPRKGSGRRYFLIKQAQIKTPEVKIISRELCSFITSSLSGFAVVLFPFYWSLLFCLFSSSIGFTMNRKISFSSLPLFLQGFKNRGFFLFACQNHPFSCQKFWRKSLLFGRRHNAELLHFFDPGRFIIFGVRLRNMNYSG